jgi:predicted nucleic acid-binding protein
MNVVVDTNVVVSSLLRNGKPRRVIAGLLEHPSYDWVITEAIRKEYEEVICRPRFYLPLYITHPPLTPPAGAGGGMFYAGGSVFIIS